MLLGVCVKIVLFSEQDLKPMAGLWTAHLKNLGSTLETLNLPTNIQDAIAEINQILIKFL
jgi:hypothetical protein